VEDILELYPGLGAHDLPLGERAGSMGSGYGLTGTGDLLLARQGEIDVDARDRGEK
jgi:hypothetical protein